MGVYVWDVCGGCGVYACMHVLYDLLTLPFIKMFHFMFFPTSVSYPFFSESDISLESKHFQVFQCVGFQEDGFVKNPHRDLLGFEPDILYLCRVNGILLKWLY